MGNRKNKRNKITMGIIISFCALIILYFGITMYFINHFYFGSTISCINVSGKTVERAEEQMIAEVEEYKLELEERENIKEEIKGSDIDLEYNSSGKVKELKEKQNPFGWIIRIFDKKDSKVEEVILYNEKLLQEEFDKLSCFDSNNIIEPQNPSFRYKEDGYVIEEVKGNKINRDILYNQVVKAILKGEKTINLEASGCYEKTKYNSEDQEVIDAENLLNKYTGAEITYNFGDKTEVINGSIINEWLKADENLQITFDEEKMKKYLDKLSNTYDTVGKVREFNTSLKIIKKVSGGDYGWLINKNEEIQELIEVIKEGRIITKEPIYTQTALSRENNDIGNTYVEINMAKQHLWFYKNGILVVEGDIVTGNVNNNCSTPTGIYKLKYKQKDATLKGDNYITQVNFWMPFNGGIGIHDANWRYEFGGNIYKINGSHGCVNAPYYLANAIFENIEADDPIICYYE
ncbi:putative peptidoglycan binding domain protein [Clostridium puniceum]|uniref:Putative peptidoglycan binding domain protein n=1 Tax=Clostridium puniceum TaxID=29367 RepID=A0A1S8TUT5_9CLOT|nr:L,D-transpeptidase family protein [Clostridium puniceum]OOM81504.1 putative peptidoglycan binding domain protein [Clostridium puniceum]